MRGGLGPGCPDSQAPVLPSLSQCMAPVEPLTLLMVRIADCWLVLCPHPSSCFPFVNIPKDLFDMGPWIKFVLEKLIRERH